MAVTQISSSLSAGLHAIGWTRRLDAPALAAQRSGLRGLLERSSPRIDIRARTAFLTAKLVTWALVSLPFVVMELVQPGHTVGLVASWAYREACRFRRVRFPHAAVRD